ncbi:BTB/POZ domain protein [Trichophyton verrucosum HKI 0517]|uniref:BTB/POZ domain protein n=1 Tax=Trichophyton verrucosum (strain HKI 0517) TaxID=663202 RepID=D4DGA7_TRIVH|nr:BTB/POZ domain protein [Trichophyton verrucosum HKI 0517]EFE39124.1 BTB/POZ domain protein [Trichophyton verrucosum HKI 0517]
MSGKGSSAGSRIKAGSSSLMPSSSKPEFPFKQILEDLFRDGSYSDMEIVCNGFTFKAHRAVVCTQSEFFSAAFKSDFKEAKSRTVELPDDDFETIERVLSFLYLQEYDENGHLMALDSKAIVPSSSTDGSSAKDEKRTRTTDAGLNNVRVYVAADKFGIPLLQSLAAEKFTRWANSNWDSTEFLRDIEEIMTITPPHDRTLRDILADVISKNLQLFAANKDFLALIENFGGLGSAILFKLVDSDLVKAPEPQKLFSPTSTSFGKTNSTTTGNFVVVHAVHGIDVKTIHSSSEWLIVIGSGSGIFLPKSFLYFLAKMYDIVTPLLLSRHLPAEEPQLYK